MAKKQDTNLLNIQIPKSSVKTFLRLTLQLPAFGESQARAVAGPKDLQDILLRLGVIDNKESTMRDETAAKGPTTLGAVKPTLFIGVGGTGRLVLSSLVERLCSKPDFEETYRRPFRVLMVDQDADNLASCRSFADDAILLSGAKKEPRPGIEFFEFFPEPTLYFSGWPQASHRADDTAGAGQLRSASRLRFIHAMTADLVPRCRKLLEDLTRPQDGNPRRGSQELRIVFCGTGAGSLLPLATILRDSARDLGRPRIVGLAVLPEVFDEPARTDGDGDFANGEAALPEIGSRMHFAAQGRYDPGEGLELRRDSVEPLKPLLRELPFELLYLIDPSAQVDLTAAAEAAADGLWLQFFAAADDTDGGWIQRKSTSCGSFGTAVLRVPAPGLIDYCSRAAALSILRASFVEAIPSDPIFAALRIDPEPFDGVTESDRPGARTVRVSDFCKEEPDLRDVLSDRLFVKRVRLLAAAEIDQGIENGRFLAIFRHGHRPGERPTLDGSIELREENLQPDRRAAGHPAVEAGIASLILAGMHPKERPSLLVWAEQEINTWAAKNRMHVCEGLRAVDLKNRAACWEEEFRCIGLLTIERGYTIDQVAYPGLDALAKLLFLIDVGEGVDFAARRYAVLSLRDQISGQPPLDHAAEIALPGYEDIQVLDAREQASAIEELERQAVRRAMKRVARCFFTRLADVNESLNRYAALLRARDHEFADLEREHRRLLDSLLAKGDRCRCARSMIEAEPLQSENGRRLWDFYYEDRIADLPELSPMHPRVQQILNRIVPPIDTACIGTSGIVTQVFSVLQTFAQDRLDIRIAGDLQSPDVARRGGLTLGDALDLELFYGVLLRDHLTEIQEDGANAIGRIVHSYRQLPSELSIDLSHERQLVYLREKIWRITQEEALKHCFYDESREPDTGERRHEVFLAAIGEELRGTRIEEVLRGADIPHLRLVTESWPNPREVIFYHAALNVPLDWFGQRVWRKAADERIQRRAESESLLIEEMGTAEGLARNVGRIASTVSEIPN